MRSVALAALASLAGVALAGPGISLAAGCGGPDRPPPRGVIESDVGGWSFRRYQSVLDVEVWVSDNRAVAHTASYAHKEAEKRGRLSDDDVVSAFVTRYQSDAGIEPALVRFVRRLAGESGYRVEEREVGGVRLVEVRGAGEVWAIWPAALHVVKIGGPGRDSIPDAIIAAYGERYPSRLAAGALDARVPPPAAIDRPGGSKRRHPAGKGARRKGNE
jgi:predicted nucleic acid-binding protein